MTTLEHLATQDWSPVEVEAAKAWIKRLHDAESFQFDLNPSGEEIACWEDAIFEVLGAPWTSR